MHRKFFMAIALLIAYLLGAASLSVPSQPGQSRIAEITKVATASGEYLSPQRSETVRVIRVVDGDTIEIEGGRKVRYIGINSPETVDPRRAAQCFGKEASAENKRLVEGLSVRLVKDVSETDRYGRLLRYVYAGDLFVNEYLVRRGFAEVSTFPPDVRFELLFLAAQKQARAEQLGLWAGCPLNLGKKDAGPTTVPTER